MTPTRLALALLLAMAPFGADADTLFVSPKGSDRGKCNSPTEPCATIGERAAWLTAALTASPQSASQVDCIKTTLFCDIWYHRAVAVAGDCNDHPDIVLSGNDVAFRAQDSAILMVQCVNIRSVRSGPIAVQLASCDFGW
jgi:hypothetical protein